MSAITLDPFDAVKQLNGTRLEILAYDTLPEPQRSRNDFDGVADSSDRAVEVAQRDADRLNSSCDALFRSQEKTRDTAAASWSTALEMAASEFQRQLNEREAEVHGNIERSKSEHTARRRKLFTYIALFGVPAIVAVAGFVALSVLELPIDLDARLALLFGAVWAAANVGLYRWIRNNNDSDDASAQAHEPLLGAICCFGSLIAIPVAAAVVAAAVYAVVFILIALAVIVVLVILIAVVWAMLFSD